MHQDICNYIIDELEKINIQYDIYRKGGIVAHIGQGKGNKLVLMAHVDTIGMMVSSLNTNGTMGLCPIGGLSTVNEVNWNFTLHTMNSDVYHGTIYKKNSSVHLSASQDLIKASPEECVAVLDFCPNSVSDLLELGISVGDIIAPCPNFKMSKNGYIQTRFLDDKGSVAVLLTMLLSIKQSALNLNRDIDFYFTAFEETGHGASVLPDDACDIIAIEIAPVENKQTMSEHKIIISPRFGSILSNRELTKELVICAQKNNIDYELDVLKSGGTDCNSGIIAGYDVRHTIVGFGTSASHGYERTHIDSIECLYNLLMNYIS